MMLRSFFLFIFSSFLLFSWAQDPMPAMDGARLHHQLGKLRVLGSVLYIAAHPDDENTRLISYLAKGKGYRTAYLSLTRGDGGQNLIGDEKGPALGMLRTQELLAARRIDGAEQMFSRAYDFGYSKTPEETLDKWDREKVLADVVWAIRKFRPDVIITRFPGPEKGGGGHGHHTSSNILAKEAFHLAADPNAFPEQLKYVETWRPQRLYWNTWRPQRNPKLNIDSLILVDIGGYDPLLGESYGEIAARARSMHRCQAFGVARWRGRILEYLEQEKGPFQEEEIFSDINTTWERVDLDKIDRLLHRAYNEFRPSRPDMVLPILLQIYRILSRHEGYWVEYKREQLRELIMYCAGIWVEVTSDRPLVAPGDTVNLTISMLKRSPAYVTVGKISFPYEQSLISFDRELGTNDTLTKIEHQIVIRRDQMPGQPYWLVQPIEENTFQVRDQAMIGLPENPPLLKAVFEFDIEGLPLAWEAPVIHKYVDRAVGELFRPFVVAPEVTISIPEGVYLFADSTAREIPLAVKSFASQSKPRIRISAPTGWTVFPADTVLEFDSEGQEKTLRVTVSPPGGQDQGELKVFAEVNGKILSFGFKKIEYDHIPTQVLFPPSEARLVKVDLRRRGERIAYIMGSGDEIPTSLELIGYDVELLEDEQVTLSNLKQYDAVIAGIRAYNTRERMPYLQDRILEYVQQGGTYIVQYNTSYSITTNQPGPYPLTIGRGRVSVEEAPITILDTAHQVFNFPNKITQADFDGWVQERGLYFPKEWDDRYQALTSAHDPGEDPLKGALLVTKYGEGWFIYSAFSWFRELPAGVPGAYRLFTNLVSIGKDNDEAEIDDDDISAEAKEEVKKEFNDE